MQKLLDWATGDDTGASSTALCRYMSGLDPRKMFGLMAPSDVYDRGRCIRLLRIMPEWIERLDEMKQFPGWAEQVELIKKEMTL